MESHQRESMAELDGRHVNGDSEITPATKLCTRLTAVVYKLRQIGSLFFIASLDISKFTRRHQS